MTGTAHVPNAMPNRIATGCRALRLPLIAIALAALAGCETGADGFNDGTVKEAPDTALIRGLMEGLGGVDPKKGQIDYKPRAPLAMPTSVAELPPPEEPQTAADWPETQDQDLERMRAAYATTPLTGEKLTPQQMRGFPEFSRAVRERAAQRQAQYEMDGGKLTPEQMKSQKLGKVDTSNLFGPDGKPIRRYLVDPPVAYSTPAPNAPLVAPDRVEHDREAKERERREMDGELIDMN